MEIERRAYILLTTHLLSSQAVVALFPLVLAIQHLPSGCKKSDNIRGKKLLINKINQNQSCQNCEQV